MKAAVWTGIDKIEIKDLPMPTIGQEEAIIKVRVAGVCVTDFHIISGKLKIGKMPNVQGHEICGEVFKINSKREDIKIGQRCVIATSLGCGHCEHCREGKQYLCNDSSEIGYYPHNGGYAEYLKVPVSAIVSIPDEVSDLAASIIESTVCPTESLMNLGVPLSGSVFVTGVGPAGLAYIQVAKLMGATKVISLVRGEFKANRAKEYGADEIIDTTLVSDIPSEVYRLTDGKGADIVLEATGAPNVIELSFNCVKKGGTIILYGIPGNEDVIKLPVTDVITKELTVKGAVGNTKAWYPLVELISKGKLNIERMVTHKFTLDKINDAFDLYRNHDKNLIKAVIDFRK